METLHLARVFIVYSLDKVFTIFVWEDLWHGTRSNSRLSGPFRKYARIRASLHRHPRRCTPCGVPAAGTPQSSALLAQRIDALGT